MPSSAFDGAEIYCRTTGLVAMYEGAQVGAMDPLWKPSPNNPYAYAHPDFPRHVLVFAPDAVLIIQRFTGMPNMEPVNQIAEDLSLSDADRLIALPLRLRLGLEGAMPVPAEVKRGAYIPGSPVFLFVEDGVPIEVRLSGSQHAGIVTDIWAEAFLGDRYVTSDGARRAYLYTADLRRLRFLRGAVIPRFISKTVAALLTGAFTYCTSFGLRPRLRRRTGQQLFGTLHHVGANEEVVADVRLPSIKRRQRHLLVGPPAWFQPIFTNTERDLVLAHLRAGGS